MDIKVVVIRDNKLKTLFVAQVQEVNRETLFKLQKEAELNQLAREKELNELKETIKNLKHDISYLKGEE